MQHEIETNITIDAPVGVVWDVLTALASYSEWNPFVVEAAGTVAVGERLTNRVVPPVGKAMTFKPEVTEVEVNSVFEWLGRLGLPRVFDGRHRFELSSTPSGGTRLRHSEHFRGVLVPLMRSKLDAETKQGFEAMNVALKGRAEDHVREAGIPMPSTAVE